VWESPALPPPTGTTTSSEANGFIEARQWTHRSETDPFTARKVDHLRA